MVLPAARAHGGPLPSRYVRRPPPAWGHGTTGGRDHRITYRPAARHEPTEGGGYRINTPRTPARDTARDGPDYHRGSYRAGAHVSTAGATGYTLPRPVVARVHAIVAHAVIRDYQYPPLFVPSPLPVAGPSGLRPATLPVFSVASTDSLDAFAAAALAHLGDDAPLPATSTTGPLVLAGAGVTPQLAHLPGFSSVPPKLIRRITSLEFVDMLELLPESWRVDSASQSGCCPHTKRPRRGMVTDILVWAECYATMAAILSAAYLNKAPHFFAYLRTITRASRNFEGTAWASYDIVFRRQAANRRLLEWGIVDTEAYNEAFTGRARVIPRCVYCLGDTHASHECAFAPVQAPGPAPQLMFPHPYPPPPARPTRSPARALPPIQGPGTRGPSAELCRLFNGTNVNMCRYPWCRHTHLCARCRGPHPVSECPGTERRVAGPAPPQRQPPPRP